MDVLVVINPISGDKNKSNFLDFADRLLKSSKLEHIIYETTGEGDKEKVEELISSNSPKKVIIAGGDGTLNMFLSSLKNHDVKVGFIPMGSANGMAAELDLTNSPELLLRNLINSENTRKVDLLSVNDSHLLVHLGDLGANANLVSNYDEDEGRGIFTYAKYFWSEFQNLESFEFEIETDEVKYEREGVMLAICNGRTYGTGIPLNTVGKLDDGLFELVVVKAVEFSDIIKAAISKFDNEYETENLETFQAESAVINLKQPQLFQIDGEVVGEFKELKINIIPNAITFIV